MIEDIPFPEIGRIPPQAIELEEAVLGAIMLEAQAFELVSELLAPDSFYKASHALIYTAVVDLAAKSEPIDILTVTNQLRTNGSLDDVGGAYSVTMLTGKVGSSANIINHAKIIVEQHIKRRLIKLSSTIQNEAFNETIDSFDLLASTERELEHIGTDLKEVAAGHVYDPQAGDDLLYDTISGDLEMGRKFGVHALDRYLRYKKNQYLLVVGNQNVGKTFFILWMLTRLAIEHGLKFLVLVMENDVGQAKRDISQFYLEEMIRHGMSKDKLKIGLEFVKKHFKFLNTIEHRFSYLTALDAGRRVYKTWQYDGFFIDPYNALKVDSKNAGVKGYDYHLEASNEMQFFTKSVVSLILSCHITTEAARSGKAPTINDVQGGMSFTAKAHDGIVLYRDMQDAELRYITEVHVSKLKDRQTGGDWTPYAYPVRLKLGIKPIFGFMQEGSVEWKASAGENLPDNIENIEAEDPIPEKDVPF